MDFKLSTAPSGEPRVDILFDDEDLNDLRRADLNNGREAIEAMARGAGALLLERGITGDALIASPLYSFGFSVETCYDFLGALRAVRGLEMERDR